MAPAGPDENDTCQDYVRPAILAAGWRDDQIVEQYRVQADLPGGRQPEPEKRKRRADYVLELDPGLPLVVIEAKRLWAKPGDGIQQGIRYASKLDVPLALSTNGTGWVQYNATTGIQGTVDSVPGPIEAWDLFSKSNELPPQGEGLLRTPLSRHLLNADGTPKEPRYYQRRAVNAALSAIARKQDRVLLVMATGSGKTFTALQLVWKLWNFRKRRQAETDDRNYRVLYLADRDVLVADPWRKTFRPVFGEASVRANSRNTRHSPDIYFATYQALDTASVEADSDSDINESRDLLQNYPPDFFDLVIVDECHRGSARETSEWRNILDYFSTAVQLGLTATPIGRRDVDTYQYFGNPVFTYSLAEGIEDGFLAPYSIRKVVFDVDADGLEIVEGLRDIAGREIPAGTYGTRDYERRLRLPDRTRAMAKRLDAIIGNSWDRAVVFCVDSEHALTMTEALRNLRPDKTRSDPEWVTRIMSIEREKDRLLEQFTDPERDVPQIAVTVSLLSTGVDIEDLKYVVIARPVGSLPEFKQIIGRGTRLYPEKDKTEFEIIDFVGATEKFRDPQFDGPPLKPPSIEIVTGGGDVQPSGGQGDPDPGGGPGGEGTPGGSDSGDGAGEPAPDPGPAPGGAGPGAGGGAAGPPREVFELHGVPVTLTSEGFWVHDIESGRPRLVRYVDWVGERVLASFDDPDALLTAWSDPATRAEVVRFLHNSRIDVGRLANELGGASGQQIDTVDQLLHLAWGSTPLTRAERARRAKCAHAAEIESYPKQAREILAILLDRYAEAGIEEISAASFVQVPPLSDLGSPIDIAARFGGAAEWHRARGEAQRWLYSA